MRTHQALRLALALVIGVLLLVVACTSATPTTAPSDGITVKLGPMLFQLPALNKAEVKTTPSEAPAINDGKIFTPATAPAEQVQPATDLKALDRATIPAQSEFVVGDSCGHDGH